MSSIKRKPHILKGEKTLAVPRHLIFFDTETNNEPMPCKTNRQIFRLGCCVYYKKAFGRHLDKECWKEFLSIASFWEFLFHYTGDKTKLWCIARNLTFDFTILKGWEYLKKAGYKLKFFHNQGTCNIISVRKGSSSIVFLDSMNWFRESLAKTGERIGIPKMKIDFKTCTDSELMKYCRNDVKIELENFKIFIRFLQANKIGRLCYTKGSTAMASYLLRHYNTKIYIHNNKQAIDLERESYKGGRVECFYLGELNDDNYFMLDVNSLYPYVMRNNLYPVKYERILHGLSVDTFKDIYRSKSVTAKVLIETDEPVYAVRRERTVFPVGKFWTVLSTPEIDYAIENRHLKGVRTCVIYEQANIFKTYVDMFYELRKEFKTAGVKEYDELCKYMLNTLYGKFGQKGENWNKIGECPNEPDREELVFNMGGKRVTKIRYLLGEIFLLKGHGESFDSFPAIASHVTAFGRMYLWYLMKQAGQGNYFYCDTDSLIVNEKGLSRLEHVLHTTKLGGLKRVDTASTVSLRGLKDYTFAEKIVTKGIRKTANQIEDGVYEQEQWPSFRGVLRSGNANEYTIKTIVKHLNREYTKGVVTNEGWVTPFVYVDGL